MIWALRNLHMIEILFQNADVETSVIIKNEDTEDTYQYTFEKPTKWTPYNSNLHMHTMKVSDGSYCTGIDLFQSSTFGFCSRILCQHLITSGVREGASAATVGRRQVQFHWQGFLHPRHGQGEGEERKER